MTCCSTSPLVVLTAPAKGYLTEQLQKLPELSRVEMPALTIKEFDQLMDSSCMGPKEWALIARDIEENYLKFDGFVVIMGTDTMAYAASAMSFMLENLGKPIFLFLFCFLCFSLSSLELLCSIALSVILLLFVGDLMYR